MELPLGVPETSLTTEDCPEAVELPEEVPVLSAYVVEDVLPTAVEEPAEVPLTV